MQISQKYIYVEFVVVLHTFLSLLQISLTKSNHLFRQTLQAAYYTAYICIYIREYTQVHTYVCTDEYYEQIYAKSVVKYRLSKYLNSTKILFT